MADVIDGTAIAETIPMIATATSVSISVNPRTDERDGVLNIRRHRVVQGAGHVQALGKSL
jgi:hypothetical protein